MFALVLPKLWWQMRTSCEFTLSRAEENRAPGAHLVIHELTLFCEGFCVERKNKCILTVLGN